MIVGIDDSGNFDTDKHSFYVAIFIRPKKYGKIQSVFLNWEQNLPDNVKEDGEVKGKLLNKSQLIDFAKNILTDNGYGAIKIQVVGVDINDNNTEFLLSQRDLNVNQLKQQAKEVYRDKGKEFTQTATFYEQMSDWLASKSLKTLYKIEILGITIIKAINLSIISSTLRNFDKELGKLEINIDHGITGRASVDRYWRDVMRTTFWSLTSSVEPIIHITEWRHNHPFIKRFIKYPKHRGAFSLFTNEIRNVYQLHDSKDKFEIRIADIVASAFFRNYTMDEDLAEPIRLILRQRVEFGSPYIKVGFVNRRNPNPINPYTDRIDGITADELKAKYGDDS